MRTFLTVIALLVSFHAYATEGAPEHYGSTISKTFNASTVSTVALPRNLNRAYLFIQNQGSQAVIVNYGAAQTALNEGIFIPGGASTIFEPHPSPVDSLYIKTTTSSSPLWIIEGIR